MQRWNGWGDQSVSVEVAPQTLAYLQSILGESTAPQEDTFEEVCSAVPESRLPEHRLVGKAPEGRLRHSRGQSLPDLIALRSGQGLLFPDGVAFPSSTAEVEELISYAREHDVSLIPYGGGTSVVGHVNPPPGERPVLTVDLRNLDRLVDLDHRSRLATFGAGVRGADLEASLRARGYTLGHYPQSFEYSTLGGWVATRSSGQQSLGYGRIEDLFVGGRLVTPSGSLHLKSHPASAAGPDLKHLVLGSEGRFGILTEATVRVSPLPEAEGFYGIFFPDWESAVEAARELVQAGTSLSMVRVSDPRETETNLALSFGPRKIAALEFLLNARAIREGKCLAIIGVSGTRRKTRLARREALRVTSRHGGVNVGSFPGRGWARSRFRAPYLRDALWETGYAADTLETATRWSNVNKTHEAIQHALRPALEDEAESVHVFSHLSHLYKSGSSIYTTFVYRSGGDPAVALDRWRRLKKAASEAIIASGATISHHHGVGSYHAPYMHTEKGELGVRALEAALETLDEPGVMNPAALLDMLDTEEVN
ncbi:MAG: FAD-binding oxidoreductase [Rubrobacteraceae bacterium]